MNSKKSGFKFVSKAIPVGVTNSDSIGPPKVIRLDFSKIFRVAGAGMDRIPCAVLIFPPLKEFYRNKT